MKAVIRTNGHTIECKLQCQEVYDVLFGYNFNEEECIEADSWSELACVGNVFEADNFEVEITD